MRKEKEAGIYYSAKVTNGQGMAISFLATAEAR